MINKNHLCTLEGTVVAVLKEEILFVKELNLSQEALKKTPEEWLASNHISDIYRLTGIPCDVSIGTQIRVSFTITTMSYPPLAPVVECEVITPVADDKMLTDDHLRTLEGTVVKVLEEELLFVKQLNLSQEALAKTAEEWLASDHISDIYRLTGIASDVSVGTEIRVSFAITTMSIPPLALIVEYEVMTPVADDTMKSDDHLRTLEGTIVEVSEEEFLFVKQLNLSKEDLAKTGDEWLASDHISDIYRLTGIGSDVSVGTEIRVSFAITTMSIPPLAPVVKYEVITPAKDDKPTTDNHLSTLEGTVVAILKDELLFVKQLNLSQEALEKTAEEWLASDYMSDIYRLTGVTSDVDVGTKIRISFAIRTPSIPPLVPVVNYEVISSVVDEAV